MHKSLTPESLCPLRSTLWILKRFTSRMGQTCHNRYSTCAGTVSHQLCVAAEKCLFLLVIVRILGASSSHVTDAVDIFLSSQNVTIDCAVSQAIQRIQKHYQCWLPGRH